MATPVVREHMTPNPITVDATTSVAKAQRIMQEKGVRHLPVLREDVLVGMVTLTDILEAASQDTNRPNFFEPSYLLAALPVEELMTPEPVTIAPEDTVLEAADLMFQHDIGSLPVVWDQNVIGIITTTDIFYLVVRMLAERERK
ncbi:MAG: CBS domain-containing protein [Anaerolineae bacterium]